MAFVIKSGANSQLTTPNLFTIKQDGSGNLGIYNPSGTEVAYFDSNGDLTFLVNTQPTSININAIGMSNTLNRVEIYSKSTIGFTNAGFESMVFTGSGFSKFGGILTSGLGVPAIYANYSTVGNAALVSNALNYTPPAAAGTYRINVQVNVHTAAAVNMAVTVTYKDAGGNAQSFTVPLLRSANTTVQTNINNITGIFTATFIFQIDNSATAITLSTTGTTMTLYDLAAVLEQIA